jgi:HSP20 family protein
MNKLLFYPKTIFESIFDDPYFFDEDKSYSERVVRNDEGYIMESYLPGMNKKNLNVEIDDSILSIVGKYESKNDVMSDMSYTYSKKYKVPIDVDQSQISADIKDGILRIKFPYSEIKKKKKRVVSL